jgi:hypothetical protein
MTPNRLVATIFGAVYILVGLVGFAVTASTGFAATEGGLLLGIFSLNPLHNVVHLLVGAVLLYAGLRLAEGGAATVNTVVGGVYLLVGILGLFLVGGGLNILALNAADNVLHFASAVVLLGVGLGARARVRA